MAEKEPKTASFDEESSVDTLSISGQIAKESANEIQYRTCSWQKVCVSFRGVKASQRIGAADRRLAVLGVYLPCHSVLPLVRFFFRPRRIASSNLVVKVIFSSRVGSWGYRDSGCGRYGAIHLSGPFPSLGFTNLIHMQLSSCGSFA
jgi:hypothetical protein